MNFTSENFFIETKTSFTSCDRPDRDPDYTSDSGSSYWYTEDGVIRESNHWGRGVATCEWLIDDCYFGYGMRCGYPRIDENGDRYLEMINPWCDDADHRFDSICGFSKWTDFQTV